MSTSTGPTQITLNSINIPLWDLYYKKKSPANLPPSSFSHAMENSKNILFTNFRSLGPIIKGLGNNFKERMEKAFEKLIQRLSNIEMYVFSNHGYIEFFFPNANVLKGKAFERTIKGKKPSLLGGDRLIPIFFLPILFSELCYTYYDSVFAFNDLIEDERYKKREDIHQLSENLSYITSQEKNEFDVNSELKKQLQEKDELIRVLQDELAKKETQNLYLTEKIQNLLVTINNMSRIF